jgi:hypothetical protein
MMLRHSGGVGEVVAICDETDGIIAGQIVRVTYRAGKAYAKLVTSDDASVTSARVGLAYVDMTTKSARIRANASLTSREYATIAKGATLVVLSGADIYIDTDQLEDGNYQPNSELAIDYSTARLAIKGTSDTKVGQVSKGAIVAAQNRMISCRVTIGSM